MLDTLLKILSWDLPSPEILLEEDGDLGLDWPGVWVSINKDGVVNWSILSTRQHGTDIDELHTLIMSVLT